MKRDRLARYEITSTAGESVRALCRRHYHLISFFYLRHPDSFCSGLRDAIRAYDKSGKFFAGRF